MDDSNLKELETIKGKYSVQYIDLDNVQVHFKTSHRDYGLVGNVKPGKAIGGGDNAPSYNAECFMRFKLTGSHNEKNDAAEGFVTIGEAIEWIIKTTESYLPFEVKYTIEFMDERPIKEGRFPFPNNNPKDSRAFRYIAKMEPDLEKAKSLIIRIEAALTSPSGEQNSYLQMEGKEVRLLLMQLNRPF